MGGVRKYMPITWITSLLGSLALIGTPLFSGFYSKDSIIEAVHFSHLPAAGFAHFAVLAGVFVTAFYSFRMYFLVFHGKERFDQNPDAHHGDHHGHDDHHGHGHHTGIGLFLAKEILSITGFSIRECGVQGVGARFEILVPNGGFRT